MAWSCPQPHQHGNRNCVKPRDFFVIARQSPSALREIRGHLKSPQTLGVQIGVALVLGVPGPFGPFDTFGDMRPGPRMAYWAIVVFATYGAGYTLSELAASRFSLRPVRRWWRVLLAVGTRAEGRT